MITIDLRGQQFPIYALCILSSIIVGFIYSYIKLRYCRISNKYILYSMMINIICIVYGGLQFAYIINKQTIGLSSLGGAIGMILGVEIFTRIYKDHTKEIKSTYIISLSIMYSISKLGCLFAGCCYGIDYNNTGYIKYIRNNNHIQYLFPIQLVESLIFFVIFIILNLISNKYKNCIIEISLLSYSLCKFTLDYLRFYNERNIFSINQLICIIILSIILLKMILINIKNNKKETKKIWHNQ